MALLMFTILINQNIVRSLKDSLVHTLVGSEVISFIKLWGELPLGILFVMIYTWLCDRMSTEKAFRVIFIFFLSFYLIFAFILYPNQDYFHPNIETIDSYIKLFPHFKWYIIMWGKWSLILVYIMGELWPMIIFTLLFWQLANKITKTEEASRFYPFFSLFGQANCLIAGSVVIYFSSNSHFLMPFFSEITDSTEVMIKSNIVIVTISGIISLLIHAHIEKKIIKNEISTSLKKTHIKKPELGLFDSFKMIIKSRYLGLMAIILISYSF
jgi:ATP/ADP translocase